MSNDTRVYFAYGSNMSVRRLRERVSSARPLGVGWLPAHRLMFRKKSQDNSGKCDIVPSDLCTVYGVLFEIESSQERDLDRHEGLNYGYLKRECHVHVDAARCMPTFTYYAAASHLDNELKPYTWYLTHVMTGAREASLPEAYINEVSSTKSIEDRDRTRQERELRIYQQGESREWRRPEQVLEHPNLEDCRHQQSRGRRGAV